MKGYKRYKWFFTSSGKLVVGGKSAEQNDGLLKKILEFDYEMYVMHTTHPGSPFCVIISGIDKVLKKDLEEMAVFTGCFSRAWKEGKSKTEVHLFKTSQVSKDKGMKAGTWRVNGKVHKKKVELKLCLIKQKRVFRAVPEISVNDEKVFLRICPGNIDKEKMMSKFKEILGRSFKKEEIMSALPAGGVRIC